jgi:hypothetical protein
MEGSEGACATRPAAQSAEAAILPRSGISSIALIEVVAPDSSSANPGVTVLGKSLGAMNEDDLTRIVDGLVELVN